jgi:hypothetical protein
VLELPGRNRTIQEGKARAVGAGAQSHRAPQSPAAPIEGCRINTEWQGLPEPESIDAIDHTWTMDQAQYMALLELIHAESNGRRRLERYQSYICEAAGIRHWIQLDIVVQRLPLNS